MLSLHRAVSAHNRFPNNGTRSIINPTLQLSILVRHMVMMIKVRVYLQIKHVSRAMSFKVTKRVRCVIGAGQSLTSKDTEPFKWCRAGSIYSAMS